MALGRALRLARRGHLERLRGDAARTPYAQPERAFENPETKRRFRNLLDVTGVLDQLVQLRARPATDEDDLHLVHTADYIAHVRAIARSGGGDAGGVNAPLGPERLRHRASWRLAARLSRR